MRLSQRLAIVLGAIVIFSVTLSGCGPQIPGPYTFEHAAELEKKEQRDSALQIYAQIVRENQRTNPDMAAKALYEGGIFASDPNRYGKTPELQNHGEEAAAQMWKQLRDEFPSQAATLLKLGQPGDKLAALADRIDKRNSKDWKYQLIEGLVQLTGKTQAFSYGLALVILAFLVKLLMFPLARKQYAAQREMQKMQPLIKDLQKKFKGAELSQKQMELYKEHGVNPFAGCAPTLMQLPFLILIFTAIREYEFAFVHGKFLWVGSGLSNTYPNVIARNLASPDMPLLIMYALTNYITMRLSPAADPQQQQQQNTMALMTSGIFFWMFLSYRWSSAFVLYWLVLNILSIWQQYHFIYKPHKIRQAEGGVITLDAPPPSKSSESDGAGSKNGSGSSAGKARPISGDTGNGQSTRVRPRKKKR